MAMMAMGSSGNPMALLGICWYGFRWCCIKRKTSCSRRKRCQNYLYQTHQDKYNKMLEVTGGGTVPMLILILNTIDASRI